MALLLLIPSPTDSITMGYKSTNHRKSFGIPLSFVSTCRLDINEETLGDLIKAFDTEIAPNTTNRRNDMFNKINAC